MKKIATYYRYGRWLVALLLFNYVFDVMTVIVPLYCEDCGIDDVNPQFLSQIDKLQTGDIMMVKSDDFFSRMFLDLGECGTSTAKIIIRDESEHYGYGKLLLLMSDAEDLSNYKQALDLANMLKLLSTYKTMGVSVYRPKELTEANKKAIHALAQRAKKREEIIYDFAFDNSDFTRMNCDKVLIQIYGDYLRDDWKEKDVWEEGQYPCNIKWHNLEQIIAPMTFWKEGAV